MSYSVKEAANLSGMTIRTLRYYDEIELLPIERNTSNHRVYDMHDILKLSMIRSLKEIGISLEDIKDILKNNTKSMDDSLLLQEQLLDIKINNLKIENPKKINSKYEILISFNLINKLKWISIKLNKQTLPFKLNFLVE